MTLAPAKPDPWQKRPKTGRKKIKLSDDEINEKYERGDRKILLEMNREKLPSFAESLNDPKYISMRPFYQRRDRWDVQKQSRLIESFLMNIPVPPIILYEVSYNSYEVMDGQQRVTAIKYFYNNQFKLTGLELWPELEGRTYDNLPSKIKDGINRRAISTIVIVTESLPDQKEALSLKQRIFERLNTQGVNLSRQEIRNCVYSGNFNQLLLKLSQNHIFMKAWDIPIDNEEERKNNRLYERMDDVELILRFFALRDIDEYTGNLSKYLDDYMAKSISFSDEQLQDIENIFNKTIELAFNIYEGNLFKPFDVVATSQNEQRQWKSKAYKVYYDAVMIGWSNYLPYQQDLLDRKNELIEATIDLFKQDYEGIDSDNGKYKKGLFTGEGTSKEDFQSRIKIFDSLIQKVLDDRH